MRAPVFSYVGQDGRLCSLVGSATEPPALRAALESLVSSFAASTGSDEGSVRTLARTMLADQSRRAIEARGARFAPVTAAFARGLDVVDAERWGR